jgi:hypothetical protein
LIDGGDGSDTVVGADLANAWDLIRLQRNELDELLAGRLVHSGSPCTGFWPPSGKPNRLCRDAQGGSPESLAA